MDWTLLWGFAARPILTTVKSSIYRFWFYIQLLSLVLFVWFSDYCTSRISGGDSCADVHHFLYSLEEQEVGAWRSWCRNDRTIISVAFYNIHLYIRLGNEHVKTSYYWVRMHSVDMYENFFLATTELLRDSFLRGRGCCSKKNRIVFISIIMFDETYNKQFWYNTHIK